MRYRTKPVQIKFSLTEEKALKLEEYLKENKTNKQTLFEAFVDSLLENK